MTDHIQVLMGNSHELPTAIAATGHDINDVKMVILGHLHLDHAGGLGYFADRQIPIWVHEQELRHAFWALSSKEDPGFVLLPSISLESTACTDVGEVGLTVFICLII